MINKTNTARPIRSFKIGRLEISWVKTYTGSVWKKYHLTRSSEFHAYKNLFVWSFRMQPIQDDYSITLTYK